MNIARLALFALLSAPPTIILGAPAVAQTQTDCRSQITSLRGAASTVAINGRNADRDRSGLVTKLDAASAELA